MEEKEIEVKETETTEKAGATDEELKDLIKNVATEAAREVAKEVARTTASVTAEKTSKETLADAAEREELEKYACLIGEDGVENILKERKEKREKFYAAFKREPDERMENLKKKLAEKIEAEEMEAKQKQVDKAIENAKAEMEKAKGEDPYTRALKEMAKNLF